MSLAPNQQQAANLMAEGISQKEVANKVGVTEQTVCKWKKLPEFEAYINQLRWDALMQARDQIQAMGCEAADTLREIMQSCENDAIRLKASLAIFDLIGMSHMKEGLWGWGFGPTTAEGVEKELARKNSPVAQFLGDLF